MKGLYKWLIGLIRKHKAETIAGAIGFCAIHLILIAKGYRGSMTIDPQTAGEFGDFVGGYFGPLFALVGVVLLVTTLKEERISAKHENFETKYFELLKMHRDNVAAVELKGTSGRKVFVLMMREFRCALAIVKSVAKKSNVSIEQRDLLHIAYYCLFFGVGPNSSRLLISSLSDFDPLLIIEIERALNNRETKERVRIGREFAYKPFEGHQSRLGHYYRHLYQMVRYVEERDIEIDKYEYIKTIRAQLSTHEQALLLLNSLTPMGHDWWDKHLIDTYRLVQNIPKDFFDENAEVSLDDLFGTDYFEWQKSLKPSSLLE